MWQFDFSLTELITAPSIKHELVHEEVANIFIYQVYAMVRFQYRVLRVHKILTVVCSVCLKVVSTCMHSLTWACMWCMQYAHLNKYLHQICIKLKTPGMWAYCTYWINILYVIMLIVQTLYCNRVEWTQLRLYIFFTCVCTVLCVVSLILFMGESCLLLLPMINIHMQKINN